MHNFYPIDLTDWSQPHRHLVPLTICHDSQYFLQRKMHAIRQRDPINHLVYKLKRETIRRSPPWWFVPVLPAESIKIPPPSTETSAAKWPIAAPSSKYPIAITALVAVVTWCQWSLPCSAPSPGDSPANCPAWGGPDRRRCHSVGLENRDRVEVVEAEKGFGNT